MYQLSITYSYSTIQAVVQYANMLQVPNRNWNFTVISDFQHVRKKVEAAHEHVQLTYVHQAKCAKWTVIPRNATTMRQNVRYHVCSVKI